MPCRAAVAPVPPYVLLPGRRGLRGEHFEVMCFTRLNRPDLESRVEETVQVIASPARVRLNRDPNRVLREIGDLGDRGVHRQLRGVGVSRIRSASAPAPGVKAEPARGQGRDRYDLAAVEPPARRRYRPPRIRRHRQEIPGRIIGGKRGVFQRTHGV